MRNLKKLLSIVVIISIFTLSFSDNAFAATKINTIQNSEKLLDKKMAKAGLEYAKRNNKQMPQEVGRKFHNELNASKNNRDRKNVFNKYRKYAVSQDDIFNYMPSLESEYNNVVMSNEVIASDGRTLSALSSIAVGDTQTDTKFYYTYDVVNDDKYSSTWISLGNMFLSIIGNLVSPLQSTIMGIVASVPQSTLQSYNGYTTIMYHDKCTMEKSGQVYDPNQPCSSDYDNWIPYSYAWQDITYGSVLVKLWNGSNFTSYVKDIGEIENNYSDYYYLPITLRNEAKAGYDQDIITWGSVGILWPNYYAFHTTMDHKWQLSSSPF